MHIDVCAMNLHQGNKHAIAFTMNMVACSMEQHPGNAHVVAFTMNFDVLKNELVSRPHTYRRFDYRYGCF